MAAKSATFAASTRPTSIAEFLSTMPWFATLDALERRRLLSETVLKTVPAGGCLARQGDPPTFWYGVIDGLLKLCWNERDGRSLTFTGVCAGSWFGEGTVVKDEPRRYDVIALRDTRVACMPAALFNRLQDGTESSSRPEKAAMPARSTTAASPTRCDAATRAARRIPDIPAAPPTSRPGIPRSSPTSAGARSTCRPRVRRTSSARSTVGGLHIPTSAPARTADGRR